MNGGGGGGGVSHLGITLVIIFAISLLAIFAQLFYVLWRRLSFRRRTSAAGGGGDEASRYSSSESSFTAPSKELLYFFCIRPQFCLDRSSLTANAGVDERNSNHEADVEVIDIDFDLLKIQGVFGPPRFLFTIKEEEREEMESPAKATPCPAENEMQKIVGDGEKKGSVSLEECCRSAEDTVAVEIIDDCSTVDDDDDDDDDDEATPFSTPCASPVYFTPSASPVHAAVNGRSAGVATTLLV